MQERDYPKFTALHHPPLNIYSGSDSHAVLPPEQWALRVKELNGSHQHDIEEAIKEAADLKADVHLYRKRGSQFLGIDFRSGTGPTVKVLEYPEVHD